MLRQVLSLANITVICIMIWSYPLGEPSHGVSQSLQIYVCEERFQRFLEARRVTSWKVKSGEYSDYTTEKSITEIKIPWGEDYEDH